MRLRSFMVVLVFLIIPSAIGTADRAPPELASLVNEVISPLVSHSQPRELRYMGISVAVVTEQGTYFFNYGSKTAKSRHAHTGDRPNARTLFEIGSLTKVFTGISLALASLDASTSLDVSTGLDASTALDTSKSLDASINLNTSTDLNIFSRTKSVRLDDAVNSSENCEEPHRTSTCYRGSSIRLVHLATHSSALPLAPYNIALNTDNPYGDYTEAMLNDFLRHYQLVREPGMSAEYSDLGFGILGHYLAQKNKSSYEQMLMQKIMQPLNLLDTRMTLNARQNRRMAAGFYNGGDAPLWTMNDKSVLAGCGALRSTTTDLARFLRFNLNLDLNPTINLNVTQANSTRLQQAFALARQAHFTVNPYQQIGLGWDLDRENKVIWKSGATQGYSSFMGLHENKKIGVVILANSFLYNERDDLVDTRIDDAGFELIDRLSLE